MARASKNEKNLPHLLNKITIPVVALILLAVIISLGCTYFIVGKSTSLSLGKSMSVTAAVTAGAISQSLESFTNIAQEIACDPLIYGDEVDEAARQEYLGRKAAEYSIYSVDIVSPSGVRARDGADISSNPCVAASLTGSPYVGTPTMDEAGQLVIEFSVPIWSGGIVGSRVVGVFLCSAPQEMIARLISSIAVGNGGYTYIIDKNGVFVASPDKTAVEQQTNFETLAQTSSAYTSIAAVHAKARAGETGYTEFNENKKLTAVAYAPIAGSDGWSVIMCASKTEFTKDAQNIMIGVIIFMILYAVFVFIIAHPLLGKMTKPIGVIQRRLTAFAAGDVSSPVPEVNVSTLELNELVNAAKLVIANTDAIITDIDVSLDKMSRCDFDIEIENADERYVGDYASIKDTFMHIRDELSSLMEKEAEENNAIIADLHQVLPKHVRLQLQLPPPNSRIFRQRARNNQDCP